MPHKMGNPKVTAIITTHNRNDLVGRAIESVLAQTYDNLDCIVVDDASDVSSESVCGKYPVKFIYIPKAESKGGNHARNVGILASDAKYVAFLDDDDYWLPTKIEKQVALIEKKRCALVYSGARPEIFKDGVITTKPFIPRSANQGDMSRRILYGICCLNITMLIERQTLIDAGLFDEKVRFWQEYELTIRLAQITEFYSVPEALSVFRIDLKDKYRLTNKFNEWKNAVRYIYAKHADLFSQLNWLEREYVKINYTSDAVLRSKNSGRPFLAVYYKTLLWTRFMPARIFRKIESKCD